MGLYQPVMKAGSGATCERQPRRSSTFSPLMSTTADAAAQKQRAPPSRPCLSGVKLRSSALVGGPLKEAGRPRKTSPWRSTLPGYRRQHQQRAEPGSRFSRLPEGIPDSGAMATMRRINQYLHPQITAGEDVRARRHQETIEQVPRGDKPVHRRSRNRAVEACQ